VLLYPTACWFLPLACSIIFRRFFFPILAYMRSQLGSKQACQSAIWFMSKADGCITQKKSLHSSETLQIRQQTSARLRRPAVAVEVQRGSLT
jgi:hypothetical protein